MRFPHVIRVTAGIQSIRQFINFKNNHGMVIFYYRFHKKLNGEEIKNYW
jgi:hypothetical protein